MGKSLKAALDYLPALEPVQAFFVSTKIQSATSIHGTTSPSFLSEHGPLIGLCSGYNHNSIAVELGNGRIEEVELLRGRYGLCLLKFASKNS